MTIQEVIELWRKERLAYDPALKSPEERIAELIADLNTFAKENGFTETDVAEELGDVEAWMEIAYIDIQNREAKLSPP